MIATHHRRLRRSAVFLLPAPLLALLVMVTGSACTKQDARPAPPETAAPAPPPAVPVAEDRGHQKAAEVAAPESEPSALSNVERGEAERAASQRGHQSAGEQTPATQPGGGE
jgi:hypothetical protein